MARPTWLGFSDYAHCAMASGQAVNSIDFRLARWLLHERVHARRLGRLRCARAGVRRRRRGAGQLAGVEKDTWCRRCDWHGCRRRGQHWRGGQRRGRPRLEVGGRQIQHGIVQTLGQLNLVWSNLVQRPSLVVLSRFQAKYRLARDIEEQADPLPCSCDRADQGELRLHRLWRFRRRSDWYGKGSRQLYRRWMPRRRKQRLLAGRGQTRQRDRPERIAARYRLGCRCCRSRGWARQGRRDDRRCIHRPRREQITAARIDGLRIDRTRRVRGQRLRVAGQHQTNQQCENTHSHAFPQSGHRGEQ